MVELPLPRDGPKAPIYTQETIIEIFKFFRQQFFTKWNTYPAHHFHNGSFWVRISAQVWNDVSVTWLIPVSFLTPCPRGPDLGFRICREGPQCGLQGSEGDNLGEPASQDSESALRIHSCPMYNNLLEA